MSCIHRIGLSNVFTLPPKPLCNPGPAVALRLGPPPRRLGNATLAPAWGGPHPARVAWRAVGELATSPTRFWVALIAALRRCGGYAPSFGEPAVALPESPQPPPLSTILTALLQELEGRSAHPLTSIGFLLLSADTCPRTAFLPFPTLL